MMMNLFYNSESIFIEGLDIVSAPMFSLLTILTKNKKINEICDLTQLNGMTPKALSEWYVQRRHFNIFKDIIRPEVPYDENGINNLLYEQLVSSKLLWDYAPTLNFIPAIKFIIAQKLVKKIFIYYPFNYKYINKLLEKEFGDSITILNGDILDAFSRVPNDSTYVFSNIENIFKLKGANKLNMSSIILGDYRYNRKLDDIQEFKYDFNNMGNDVFKYAFFKAFV